jgi:cytochrome c biogenesis protein CcmG/thiol:disulfide interchange protein DsbE
MIKFKLLIILICIGKLSFSQSVRDFTLYNTDGEIKTYNELKGEKLTILDLWASWCKPCLKSMPKIDIIYKEYKENGVEVIGINTDGPRSISKVKPIVRVLNLSYPNLTDTNNAVMKDLEVASLPTLLMVDNKNNIVYRHEGYSSGDEAALRNKIDELLSSTKLKQ